MRQSSTIRVLIFKDGDYLVAQCLEHDVAAQGKSMKELMDSFCYSFFGHVQLAEEFGEVPLADLGEAPPVYWRMYDEAIKLANRQLKAPCKVKKSKITAPQFAELAMV